MNKKYKYAVILAILLAIILLAVYYFSHHTVAVLEPRGPIAQKEKNLLITAFFLMLLIVVPVFVITFYIVFKYREGHHGKYKPDFDHSLALESIWWLIPTTLIIVLSTITWNSTHELDPYKQIASTNPPINIEVVSLNWKWLFIYPDQNIASVNLVQFPVNTPVNMYLTSDTVMNSFWVPQLSGQIYTMPGMSTQLHLAASSIGDFYGSSSNISGIGFAGMHFIAKASSPSDFQKWVNNVKQNAEPLNKATYALLARPSTYAPVSYYGYTTRGLYSSIINRYAPPGETMAAMMGGM